MYKLNDFNKGQLVWIELTGNACRNKSGNNLIEEWEVILVSSKYVTAKRKAGYGDEIKFKEHDLSYEGLIQNTKYCVDYVLYPSEEDIKNKFEKEYLLDWIKNEFSGYGRKTKYTLEQLRKVKEVLVLE